MSERAGGRRRGWRRRKARPSRRERERESPGEERHHLEGRCEGQRVADLAKGGAGREDRVGGTSIPAGCARRPEGRGLREERRGGRARARAWAAGSARPRPCRRSLSCAWAGGTGTGEVRPGAVAILRGLVLGGTAPFDPAGAFRGGRENGSKVGPAVQPAPRPRDERRCTVARADLRGTLHARSSARASLPAHDTSPVDKTSRGKKPGSCRVLLQEGVHREKGQPAESHVGRGGF